MRAEHTKNHFFWHQQKWLMTSVKLAANVINQFILLRGVNSVTWNLITCLILFSVRVWICAKLEFVHTFQPINSHLGHKKEILLTFATKCFYWKLLQRKFRSLRNIFIQNLLLFWSYNNNNLLGVKISTSDTYNSFKHHAGSFLLKIFSGNICGKFHLNYTIMKYCNKAIQSIRVVFKKYITIQWETNLLWNNSQLKSSYLKIENNIRNNIKHTYNHSKYLISFFTFTISLLHHFLLHFSPFIYILYFLSFFLILFIYLFIIFFSFLYLSHFFIKKGRK